MSRRSPYRIELTPEERAALERRARRQTASRREVFRAQIVVLAADGLRENDEIAERPRDGTHDREPLAQALLRGSRGGPRRSPAVWPAADLFPPRVVVEIKALACERPRGCGSAARAPGPSPTSPARRSSARSSRRSA